MGDITVFGQRFNGAGDCRELASQALSQVGDCDVRVAGLIESKNNFKIIFLRGREGLSVLIGHNLLYGNYHTVSCQ